MENNLRHYETKHQVEFYSNIDLNIFYIFYSVQINMSSEKLCVYIFIACMGGLVCFLVNFLNTVSIPHPQCSRASEMVNRGFSLPHLLSCPSDTTLTVVNAHRSKRGKQHAAFFFCCLTHSAESWLGEVSHEGRESLPWKMIHKWFTSKCVAEAAKCLLSFSSKRK